METNTQVLILNVIIGVIALAGSVVGIINLRANGKIKVQLLESETRRVVEKGEVDNMSKIIELVGSVILGLKPSTDALNNAGRIFENASQVLKDLTGSVSGLARQAEEMNSVVERRDGEAKRDRETSTTRHQDIVSRLDKHQEQLDQIARQIVQATDENTLRHMMSKMLLLITEIRTDTNRLLESAPALIVHPSESLVEGEVSL